MAVRTSGSEAPASIAPVLPAVALGGALGASARYGLAQLVHVHPGTFPWATFVTNVSGSFALGLVLIVLIRRRPGSRYVGPFLATGLLGAFTTYSTFAVETDLLVRDGHVPLALAYAALSPAIGCLAVWAGLALGRRLAGPRSGGGR